MGAGDAQRHLQFVACRHQLALAEGRIGAFEGLGVDAVEGDMQVGMVGVDVRRRQPLVVGHAQSGAQGILALVQLPITGPFAGREGHH